MGNINRTWALILIGIIAISCLGILSVKLANAQTIPVPTVPTFTLQYIHASYNQIDPYTEATQQVDNSTIQVSIKNQPFNAPSTYGLYYNVRTKGHYEVDNWAIRKENIYTFIRTNPDDHVSFDLAIKPAEGSYTIVSYPAQYSPNTQIDFEVQAIVYNITSVFAPDHATGPASMASVGTYYDVPVVTETSDWSNAQTLTIPNNAISATPTTAISTITITLNDSLSGNQQLTNIALIVAVAVLGVAVISLTVYVRKIKSRTNQLPKP